MTRLGAPLGLVDFREAVRTRLLAGGRFAALLATRAPGGLQLIALLSVRGELVIERSEPFKDVRDYVALSQVVSSAWWYEREISDLFGVQLLEGSPRAPLVLPLGAMSKPPRLGSGERAARVTLEVADAAPRARGEGVFTMSYGPVRSGVFESIEYLIETPGEEIPYLDVRLHYKHRGVEERFEGMRAEDGVVLAERCEGVSSVAHAIAFCGALESLAGVRPSPQGELVRVLHAELERVANHLDTYLRHTEAAGQAVAYARFSAHKEALMRLRARLCGSRFGRGVVVVGGVSDRPALARSEFLGALEAIEAKVTRDTKLLMGTPSFVDRLRGTGVIDHDTARLFGALGPVGRGSGLREDLRETRPYGAYGHLAFHELPSITEGDALARQRVRIHEVENAFGLLRRAANLLEDLGEPEDSSWRNEAQVPDGFAVGWAEAAQGELLTWVEVSNGRLTRVKPRSASFHNLALFSSAFPRDILTDFAFIEASFGLSIAGAAS